MRECALGPLDILNTIHSYGYGGSWKLYKEEGGRIRRDIIILYNFILTIFTLQWILTKVNWVYHSSFNKKTNEWNDKDSIEIKYLSDGNN